jgi:DNA repair protein RadC
MPNDLPPQATITPPPKRGARRARDLPELLASGSISALEHRILAHLRAPTTHAERLARGKQVERALFGVPLNKVISCAPEAADIFRPLLQGRDTEGLAVALLSAHGHLLDVALLTTGSDAATVACQRQIARYALGNPRTRHVILAHNHPSGVPDPSPEDITVMRSLNLACSTLGMRLYDSIILVPGGGYVSMAERGLIPPT